MMAILSIAGTLIAIILFYYAAHYFQLFVRYRTIISIVERGMRSLTAKDIPSIEKETIAIKTACDLFISGFALVIIVLICLIFSLSPILIIAFATGFKLDDSLGLLRQNEFILFASSVCLCCFFIYRRIFSAAQDEVKQEPSYSDVDKIFHYLAFSHTKLQSGIANIENGLYGFRALPRVSKPIFIAGLARSGSTIFLRNLEQHFDVASHSYRDMPFPFAPYLWGRVSCLQSRRVGERQRLHGDGINISLSSPEALEEAVWQLIFPVRSEFRTLTIQTPDQLSRHSATFLNSHFSKVILNTRRKITDKSLGAGGQTRYLSKNNASIARLELLLHWFPDCKIIVPVRNPLYQSLSLLNQHLKFKDLQRGDGFIKRYMSDIGHFDFGLNHKPIAFPDFDIDTYSFDDLNYWLNYWVACYRFLYRFRSRVHFLIYDAILSEPEAQLGAALRFLEIGGDVVRVASSYTPSKNSGDIPKFSKPLFDESMDIFSALTG